MKPGSGTSNPSLHAGSWASSDAARRTMQANRGRDTGPELAVRRLLHAQGLRYRVDYRIPDLQRRRIDIAFVKRRIAVFIDGCFWHGCREHYVPPKSNPDYWAEKIRRNMARDLDTNHQLAERGWTVMRFWEHERSEVIASSITLALLDGQA